MKYIILMSTLVFSLSAMALPKTVKYSQYPNGDAIQEAYEIGGSATYAISPASSTDPFSSKTNKYAESKIIRVVSAAKGSNIVFGASTVSAATTDDFYIPAEVPTYFVIDADKPYVRIIQNSATAKVYVTEIY